MCVIAVSISLCVTAAVVWYFVQSSHKSTPSKIKPPNEDQTIDITSIKDEVTRLWNLPFSALPVSVDLARLASRVSIFDLRVNSLPVGQIFMREEMDALERTSFIISTVANFIENPPMNEKITKIVYEKRISDSQLWLEKVFDEIGQDSKTAQLFKVVNQTIIQPVCTNVKKMIFELIHAIPTDVRTPDGWKVIITFHPENISVTHERKEEIKGKFSFSWSLCIVLGYDLMSLEEVRLRFKDMRYEESFSGDLKARLNIYLGM